MGNSHHARDQSVIFITVCKVAATDQRINTTKPNALHDHQAKGWTAAKTNAQKTG